MNKLYFRNWILEQELPGIFQIVTYSLPNLIEAVVGTLIVTGLLLQVAPHYKFLKSFKTTSIYLSAVGITGIYVISQELKFHNLGGNNVYDPYDVIASILGLTVSLGIMLCFGFKQET